MQNCHRQLILREHWSLVIIVVLLPLLLTAAIPILPTFDDWTTLVSPDPDDDVFFKKERFLFYGYHWRPFDAIFGYILGRNPQLLFPMLNHVCVVVGHVASAFLLYFFMLKLQFGTLSRNVAVVFFLLSPGMLATVLAVDGLNQTYANVWSLAAALSYVSFQGRKKYVFWILFLIIGTLCKENALMWAIITPILAFGFEKIEVKTLKKDLLVGLILMTLYAALILVLPSNIEIHPEYVPESSKTLKGVFKFLLTTWVAVDFVALLHAPSRNLLIAACTFLLSLPLLCFIFVRNIGKFKEKRMLVLVFSLLIAVAPHVFTTFSMMHTYAALALAAMIIAVVADHSSNLKLFKIAFFLYLVAAIFVDTHLWWESYKSGQVGKEMAKSVAINDLSQPKNVYVITIQDDYPRLSSFCVIPSDAFGWGRAVQHETNYAWPKTINDTLIPREQHYMETAHSLAKEKLASGEAESVWIVDRKNVDILNSK